MKKTLVLASLLAAFGAASAQSSVTLYGYGDQGVGRGIVASTAAKAGFELNPGTGDVPGIRIGLKGSEALGGGMTASFGMETSSISGDSGLAGTGLDFARAAWFGVGGAFGDIRLGRHATVAVMHSGTQTNFGWRGTNSQVALGLRGGIDCQTTACGAGSRTSAAITYLSSNYSGLTFGLQTSLRNDGFYSNKSAFQMGATYAAGPLTVQFNQTSMGAVVGNAKTTYVGGSYNLGSVVLGLGNMSTNNGSNVKNAGLTARAKVTSGAFAYGLEITKQTKQAKATGMELGMDYNLSARTALTAAYNTTSNFQSGYFMGVRHAF